MEKSKRKAVIENLNKFCHLAKEHDYVEVTEWTNGEGWDINLNDKHISLTYGELSAINYLIKVIEYDFKEK